MDFCLEPGRFKVALEGIYLQPVGPGVTEIGGLERNRLRERVSPVQRKYGFNLIPRPCHPVAYPVIRFWSPHEWALLESILVRKMEPRGGLFGNGEVARIY